MLRFFDLRFAKPMHRAVINGKVFSCRVRKLLDDSYLIKFLDGKGEVKRVWVDRYDHRGLRIANYSPRELSIIRYEENAAGIIKAMEEQVIWPQPLKTTSTLGGIEGVSPYDIYEIDRLGVFVIAIHDESGHILRGKIKSVWHTTTGQRFEKMQNLAVSFPNPNAMEVVFEGHGEPWAHCDKRRLYRLSGKGKLTEERDLVIVS